jgi:hypothetical protein
VFPYRAKIDWFTTIRLDKTLCKVSHTSLNTGLDTPPLKRSQPPRCYSRGLFLGSPIPRGNGAALVPCLLDRRAELFQYGSFHRLVLMSLSPYVLGRAGEFEVTVATCARAGSYRQRNDRPIRPDNRGGVAWSR